MVIISVSFSFFFIVNRFPTESCGLKSAVQIYVLLRSNLVHLII